MNSKQFFKDIVASNGERAIFTINVAFPRQKIEQAITIESCYDFVLNDFKFLHPFNLDNYRLLFRVILNERKYWENLNEAYKKDIGSDCKLFLKYIEFLENLESFSFHEFWKFQMLGLPAYDRYIQDHYRLLLSADNVNVILDKIEEEKLFYATLAKEDWQRQYKIDVAWERLLNKLSKYVKKETDEDLEELSPIEEEEEED